MSSSKEHKEFIQPTEMAYARYLHGTYRHVRQSSIKVGNDHQPRWISIRSVFYGLMTNWSILGANEL